MIGGVAKHQPVAEYLTHGLYLGSLARVFRANCFDVVELAADFDGQYLLIVATPIWLGEESSVCRILIERLYGMTIARRDDLSLWHEDVKAYDLLQDGVLHLLTLAG